MTLNQKQKTVLKRFVRVVVHGLIASVVALLASPEVLDLIGIQWAPVVAVVGTAFINAADKSLRYGNDDGEDTGESLLSLEN